MLGRNLNCKIKITLFIIVNVHYFYIVVSLLDDEDSCATPEDLRLLDIIFNKDNDGQGNKKQKVKHVMLQGRQDGSSSSISSSVEQSRRRQQQRTTSITTAATVSTTTANTAMITTSSSSSSNDGKYILYIYSLNISKFVSNLTIYSLSLHMFIFFIQRRQPK